MAPLRCTPNRSFSQQWRQRVLFPVIFITTHTSYWPRSPAIIFFSTPPDSTMNISSRILNQSTIQYNQYIALHGPARPNSHSSGDTEWPSPSPSPSRRRRSGKGSTKSWVQRTFYSLPAITHKTSSSPPPKSIPNKAKPRERKIVPTVPPDRTEEPTIRFSMPSVEEGAEVFKFCLVGKFPGRRPSLEQIRDWAGKEWKLRGEWMITLLDRSHVFIKLDNEVDMVRVWPRSRWCVRGNVMKVFKWVPTFFTASTREPSSAAVWISLPSLPIVLFQEKFLYRVAGLVGKVVAMDNATRNMSRTNVARVCVEVDLAKTLPDRVRIEIGAVGFWQAVVYEKLPYYCTHCNKQGHSTDICKFSKIDEKRDHDADQEKVDSISTPKNQSPLNAMPDLHAQTCPAILNRSGRKKRVTLTDGAYPYADSRQKKRRGKPVEVIAVHEGSLSDQGPRKGHKNCSTHLQKAEGEVVVGTSAMEIENEEVIERVGNEIVDQSLGELQASENKRHTSITIAGTKTKSPTSRKRLRLRSGLFFWKRKDKTFADFSSSTKMYFPYLTSRRFSYEEISRATNNFDHSRIIGRGGFGSVYRGTIDGVEMAIKRKSSVSVQGRHEFEAEVAVLSRLSHENLVKLMGYCIEKNEMMLVYEYIPRGNLKDLSYGRSQSLLSWKQRLGICLGAARGLFYLHENRVLHRDVKTHNILVSEDYDAKLSDLGLGRLQPASNYDHISTVVAGTIGYLDPEYFLTGRVTRQSDVYSFGIILFEVLCGKPPIIGDPANEKQLLVDWALSLLINKGIVEDMVDPHLKGFIQPNCLYEFVELAKDCASQKARYRPTMGEVVHRLEHVLALQEGGVEARSNHHATPNQ